LCGTTPPGKAAEEKAVFVHASAAFAGLLAVAVWFSLCALELGLVFSWSKTGVWRRSLCRVVVLFFAASITFLFSFEPFRTAFEQYRSADVSRIELRNSSITLGMLQDMNPVSYLAKASAA
jgi:hypothetical protein